MLPRPDAERQFQDEMADVHARQRAAGFGAQPDQAKQAKGVGASASANVAQGERELPAAAPEKEAGATGSVTEVVAAASPVRTVAQTPTDRADDAAGTTTTAGRAPLLPATGSNPTGNGAPDLAAAAAGGQLSSNVAAAGAASAHAQDGVTAVTGAGGAAQGTRTSRTPPQVAESRPAPSTYRSPELVALAQEQQDTTFRRIAMALTEGGGELDMVLDPPELGRLQLHFELDGDQARLVVGAERPELQDQILANLGSLRAALQTQGIRVDQFDVRDGRSFDADRDAGDTALRGPRRRSRAVDLPASQAQRIVRRHLGGSALDILV